MLKRLELADPNSCMSRALTDEMTFVLLARDIAAPDTIRYWVRQRIANGKNSIDDPQITEALECALEMERQRAAREEAKLSELPPVCIPHFEKSQPTPITIEYVREHGKIVARRADNNWAVIQVAHDGTNADGTIGDFAERVPVGRYNRFAGTFTEPPV
jgi:hypothetical protein